MTGRDDFSELISAFLDGEVTPEEQARVEERLVDNAEDRRLFEEMRAMRNGLQSLPRRELDKDLSEIVLRRAERAMLANEPPPPAGESAELADAESPKGSQAAVVASKPMPREPANWRPLIWFGATVAAAVLVMTLAGPWFEGEREVADKSTEENDVAAPAASDMSRSHSSDRTVEEKDGLGGTSLASAAKSEDTDSVDGDGMATDHLRSRRVPRPGNEVAAGGLAEPRLGGRSLDESEDEGARLDAELDSVDRAAPTVVAGAPAPATDRPESGRPAATTVVRRGNKVVAGGVDQLEIPMDRTLLVRLELSEEALRSGGAFDQSLARNDIYYGSSERQLSRLRDTYAAKSGESGKLAGDVDLEDLEARDDDHDLLASAVDSDMQVVAIVAPEKNIRALLRDLERQPESVRMLEMDPGPETHKLKGAASTLALAKKPAPAARYARQDGAAPAGESVADLRGAEVEELEEADVVQVEEALSPLKPAAAPLGRRPSMDDAAPAAEAAAETGANAVDEPAPAPVADRPDLPAVREALERTEPQPAGPDPAASRALFGSKQGSPGSGDAGAANAAPEGPSVESAGADAVEEEAPMDLAGTLKEARGTGEESDEQRDLEIELTREAVRKTREEEKTGGGFGGGAGPGKASASATDKKRSAATNAPGQTRAERSSLAEGQDEATESRPPSPGTDEMADDDAFGALPAPELKQLKEKEDSVRRSRAGKDQRGFAARFQMPARVIRDELIRKRETERRATVEKAADDDTDSIARGGEGEEDGAAVAGAPASPPTPDTVPGHVYLFQDRKATDADAPPPERMVHVLFVIRAVEPAVNLAADVAAEEPLASEIDVSAPPPAAAIEAAEAEAAEFDAAEVDIPPAGPAEP